MNTDSFKAVQVPIARLLEHIPDPLECRQWSCDPILIDEIADALLLGTYKGHHLSYSHEESFDVCPGNWHTYHTRRIAWLVRYGWTHSIGIDVGIPSLNYHNPALLTDGYHRLCAAIYRNDETIAADVSGSIDYAFELFGIDCSQYGEMQEE